VLDINSSYKSLRAELMPVFLHNVARIDDVGLVVSPVVRFQIVRVLLLADPTHIVFVDHFACLSVGESAVHPVLRVVLGLWRLVVPLFLDELGRLYFDGWFGTHMLPMR